MAHGVETRAPAGPRLASRLRALSASSFDEVDRLEPAWVDLDRDVNYPLAHFDWIRAAMAVFSEATPHVVAAVRGGAIEALAPLVKKRLHGVPRLCLAGV